MAVFGAVVTAARLLGASEPNYDLGIQLQAAHNLLAGRGLAIYEHLSPNLADPANLVTLTYFRRATRYLPPRS